MEQQAQHRLQVIAQQLSLVSCLGRCWLACCDTADRVTCALLRAGKRWRAGSEDAGTLWASRGGCHSLSVCRQIPSCFFVSTVSNCRPTHSYHVTSPHAELLGWRLGRVST